MRRIIPLEVNITKAKHLVLFVFLVVLVLTGCATRQTTAFSPGRYGKASIVVAADGSGAYRTIKDAIARAKDGDVILVKPGMNKQDVELDRATMSHRRV